MQPCRTDLFYGTDYQSHMGTKRGGMATYSKEGGFMRSIHNLENTYFRTRFESELDKFQGNAGIGIISDTDAQPLLMNSHLGRFAIVTVAKINNQEELASKMLEEGQHLSEFSSGKINPTELVALLIIKGKDFVQGIENVFRNVKGSCSMLLLTENGIIAARDSWGRTPVVIGKKNGAMAATSESTAFPNLDYDIHYYLGPGEKVYSGMIIGQSSKAEDIELNVCKKKHLTNTRSSSADEALTLVPPRKLSLEQALDFIDTDELLEVTPESLRIRKRILDPTLRKRASIARKNAMK